MDEIVFDPGVLDILDGKDLRIIISAKDDQSCVVTAAIALPGNGTVIAVPHSQVLRAGGEISFRIPLAVKVEPELLEKVVEKPKRKRTPRKKAEEVDKEE